MKIIDQSVELVKQGAGYDGLLRHIERCGRICYKSEDKITEDSAEAFVDMILHNKHFSVLEHGTLMTISDSGRDYAHCPFAREEGDFIVTNARYYHEEMLDFRFIEEEMTIYPQKPYRKGDQRVTFHVVTSRAIMDELLRHRTLSASVESTRYCNYSKGKFNGELTFMKPYYWQSDPVKAAQTLKQGNVQLAWEYAERLYMQAIKNGATPQEARAILPMSIKSEAYLTAFVDDWIEIIKKRIIPQAHPEIASLCGMISAELFTGGYIPKKPEL